MADILGIRFPGVGVGTAPPKYAPTPPIAGLEKRFVWHQVTEAAGVGVASVTDIGTDASPAVQADTAKQPTVLLTGGGKTLNFDGTDDSLTSTFSGAGSSVALSIACAMYLPAATAAQQVVLGFANRRLVISAGANALTLWNASAGPTRAFTPGWHFVGAVYESGGTASRLYLDGEAVQTGNVGTGSSSVLTFGAFASGFPSKARYGGEFLAKRASWNGGDFANIRAYMKQLYPFLGLP